VTWTIIEPGIYLLSACALSFKPLFRMSAKALHLHAFITHTKSTFQQGKCHTTKVSMTGNTQSEFQLHAMPPSKLRQPSEDGWLSDDSKSAVEVSVGQMANTDNEEQAWSRHQSEIYATRNIGSAV
jgi:hypothetical protein